MFLGGTIGNVTGRQRSRLLLDLQTSMSARDHLLLGTDLVKPVDRLLAAYDDDDDAVTARFNRELHATFRPDTFDHVAVWNPQREWIEMRLRSQIDQRVHIGDLDLTVTFARGEELLTEISDKFRPGPLTDELTAARFVVDDTYRDNQQDFQLTLARPYC